MATLRPPSAPGPGLQLASVTGILHQHCHTPSNHPPKSRTYACNHHAAERDQKRDDRGLPMRRLLQRQHQGVGNRAQQRQASDCRHQLAGKRRQQSGDGGTENSDQQIEQTARCGRGIPARRVGVGFGPHADGSSNGTQIQGKRTKRGQHQRHQTRQGDGSGDRDACISALRTPVSIPRRVDCRHARQVLRSHGHDEQRQAQADQRRHTELRRHPHRTCQIKCDVSPRKT